MIFLFKKELVSNTAMIILVGIYSKELPNLLEKNPFASLNHVFSSFILQTLS